MESNTFKIAAAAIIVAAIIAIFFVLFEDRYKQCEKNGGVIVRSAGHVFKLSCVKEIKL